MKLNQAVKTFNKLQTDFNKGKIKEKKFQEKTENILAKSSDGISWKVDTTGQWHKFVDNKWIPSDINNTLLKGPENLSDFYFTTI